MIEMTIKECVDMLNDPNTRAVLENPKIKAKISFRIKSIFEVLRKNSTHFEAVRNELFSDSKYGTPMKMKIKDPTTGEEVEQDHPNQRVIKPECMAEFTKEFEELLNEKIQIEDAQIKIDDLGDIEISPASLLAMTKIIIQ